MLRNLKRIYLLAISIDFLKTFVFFEITYLNVMLLISNLSFIIIYLFFADIYLYKSRNDLSYLCYPYSIAYLSYSSFAGFFIHSTIYNTLI